MEYVYVVWFRDSSVPTDDPHYEWVACFYIEAETKNLVQEWGDHLSRKYSARYPDNEFLFSEVHDKDDPLYDNVKEYALFPTPRIVYGEEASDEKLGW